MKLTDHTLQDLAAQLVFPRLGSNMNPPVLADEDLPRFQKLLADYPFGGLVLFNGRKNSTPALLAALQQSARIPLLVTSDIERGTGQQMKGATLFPHAMAIGKAGQEAVATFAKITAREALACGIHIAFAPVADVNSDPNNPIIGIRAFGNEMQVVTRCVSTFVQTTKAHGLLTCAKHFPGHGNTATDSHAELPTVDSSKDTLASVDLPPFQSAIAHGTDLIMTAHVAYPALDPVTRPATASPPILTTLLREQLGFQGPVITDSLIMGAIQTDDTTQLAANLLNAGVDIFLDPPDPVAMVKGIIQATEQKLVSIARLQEAAARIDLLRQHFFDKFGPTFFTSPYLTEREVEVGAQASLKKASDIAAKAIEEIGIAQTSPDRFHQKQRLIVFIKPYRTHLDPPQEPLHTYLKNHSSTDTFVQIDVESSEKERARVIECGKKADTVIIAVVSKPAAWRTFGLPENLGSLVKSLVSAPHSVLVSFGDPALLNLYPEATYRLCTYSDVPASQEAFARLIS